MKAKARFTVSYIVVLGVALVCNTFLFGQPGLVPNWKDRFLAEAPRSWKLFHTRAARLQGTASTRISKVSPKKELVVQANEKFKQGPGCASIASQTIVTAEGEKKVGWDLAGANSKYQFNLRRRGSDGPWTLIDVVEGVSTNPQIRMSLAATYRVRACVSAPIAINFNLTDDWLTMVSSSDFTILSVTAIDTDGMRLVKVEFDLRWTPSEANPIRVVGRGRVWFDPLHLWVMRKCEYKMQRGPKGAIYDHSGAYDYETDNDEIPLLTRLTVRNYKIDGRVESEESTEFSLALADVSEHEFTLSAFGIPEPVGVVWPKSTRWWLWISLAAVGTVVLGYSFLKLRRRFQNREPTPTNP